MGHRPEHALEVPLGDAAAHGNTEAEVGLDDVEDLLGRRARRSLRGDVARSDDVRNSRAKRAAKRRVQPEGARTCLEPHVVEQPMRAEPDHGLQLDDPRTSACRPSCRAPTPPIRARRPSATLWSSVVHGDAHREVLVDERVQADDELELGVDGEHERDVDACDVTRDEVGFVSCPYWVAEADLCRGARLAAVPSQAVRGAERVDEDPVSGAGAILGSEVHRRDTVVSERAVDDPPAGGRNAGFE